MHVFLSPSLEVPSPVQRIVTSTPAETKRAKKMKRRERRAAEIADEDKTRVTSGSEGDASERRTQHGNLCIRV